MGRNVSVYAGCDKPLQNVVERLPKKTPRILGNSHAADAPDRLIEQIGCRALEKRLAVACGPLRTT